MRNSFLNLAIPSLMMSEPGASEKIKIKENLEVTLWDRWEINDCKEDIKLEEVVRYFEEKYKLSFRDIFSGSIPLYLHQIQGKIPSQKQEVLSSVL